MRHLTAIVLLTLFLMSPALQAGTRIGDLQFADNFDSLMTLAQHSQKLIVIDWFTDW